MDAQGTIGSKKIKIAALAVGAVFIVLTSFAGGVAVGLKKARFSYKFGENYERNFIGGPLHGPSLMGILSVGGGPGSRGIMPDFEGRGFRNAHGIAGDIVSVADNKIVIRDREDQENTVLVDDGTLIKLGRDTIGVNDLKNGDRIVVMGNPGDDGMVKADLIRVFDK